MAANERCSNCAYWQHRTCVITGETRNDGPCNCGQFRDRKEN